MRIVKVAFWVIFVLMLIAAAGIYIFIKTFDISRYQERITSEISRQLGREVVLDKIGLEADLARGITLVISDFQIADAPDFSSEYFMRADRIFLQVNPFEYLQTRSISVPRIDIIAPKLRIIRDANGKLNIPHSAPAVSPTGLPRPPSSVPTVPAAAPSSLSLAWVVDSLQIKDGVITWIDRMQNREISITRTGLTLRHFSLSQPFDIEAETALFSGQPNIFLKGRARLSDGSKAIVAGDPEAIIVEHTEIKADLDSIELSQLLELLPEIKPAGLKSPLQGQISLILGRLSAGPAGITELSIDGQVRNGRISAGFIPAPLEKVQFDLGIRAGKCTVKSFSGALSSGTITGQAEIADLFDRPKSSLNLRIAGLPAQDVLPPLDSKARLTGVIEGQADLRFQGFTQHDILSSVSGPIQIKINDGKLENLNVLRTVLERISIVPNLVEGIYSHLPDRYKQQLEKKETVFQKIEIEMQGQDRGLTISGLNVVADTFSLNAQGRLDEQLNLDLASQLLIPADLSLSMVQAVDELEYIRDQDGRIMIPLKYRGPLRSVRFMPDLNYLSKRILINRGTEELDKLLDRVFDREEQEVPLDENAPQQLPKKSPERELIENILDSILN